MTVLLAKIVVEGEFTSLNEYIDAERANRYRGAEIKHVETERVRLGCYGYPRIETYPVSVRFFWARKTRRTDPDNISAAQKFVLDGLVAAGVLDGDGWKHIGKIEHTFGLDPNPFVAVYLEPYEIH